MPDYVTAIDLTMQDTSDTAGEPYDCTWGNDNKAHCVDDFCLTPIAEGEDEVCYVGVPICFDKYGREVDC